MTPNWQYRQRGMRHTRMHDTQTQKWVRMMRVRVEVRHLRGHDVISCLLRASVRVA